jgi:hypothetical protein
MYHDFPTLSDDEVAAGVKLLEAAAMDKIPAYEDADFRWIFELAHGIYAGWRCWKVELVDGLVLIDGQELLAWIEARKQDPGWDELTERSYRLRSIHMTPACLIGSFRHVLLHRAAAGEDVRIGTGEKSTYRHTWIIEDGKYQDLWIGNEEQWRAELCDPDAAGTWSHCRRICHRRGYDGY